MIIKIGFITRSGNIGASIIRLGFWGPLYYIYNKELHNSVGNF